MQPNAMDTEYIPEPATPQFNLEEAKRLLQKEQEEKVQRCNDEIQNVLQKYGCTFDIGVVLTANKVEPLLRIIPVS